MSRTALHGYVIGDVEKEFLFKLITERLKRIKALRLAQLRGLNIGPGTSGQWD